MATQHEIRALVGRERVRSLSVRRDGPGLAFLAAHLALLVAGGAWIWAWSDEAKVIVPMILHGIVVVHLFAPFHETSHGSAFATRRLNDAVEWFCGLALGLPPTHFRFEHAEHHAYTQQPGRDPEMIASAETLRGYLVYATAWPYFRSLVATLLRLAAGRFNEEERRFLPDLRRDDATREARLMLVAYGAVAAASVVAGSWVAVQLWLLPRILGEPFMRLIRMSEHVGRPQVADWLANTRTVLTWRPVRWLAWNMAFHAEHHAVPSVPFHALPDLHGILADRLADVRRGYLATQLHLIRNGIARGG
ncbi:MAG: fatty acid desaturase [Alphaproteobacteria bacterium]|nr:fatty acid desaturase [Alphaproteobacteria bacterium]